MLTTTELVEAARQRDQRAWAELLARYGDLVRSVVSGYRLQEADAADAEQNTWLRLVERLDTLRNPEGLGAWLRTTAGRECLASIRRTRRDRPSDALAGVPIERSREPESLVLAAEADRAALTAVAELTPRRRQLVHELFFRPDRDYSQVSRSLGMPIGSIGPTRGRVLVNLRDRLERAGFGPAARAADDPLHRPRLTA